MTAGDQSKSDFRIWSMAAKYGMAKGNPIKLIDAPVQNAVDVFKASASPKSFSFFSDPLF